MKSVRCLLIVIIGVLTLSACGSRGAAPDGGAAQTAPLARAVADAHWESGASYRREAAGGAAPSDKYMLSARVKLSGGAANYRVGLAAGIGKAGENVDFLYNSAGGEFSSLATLWGADRRVDLGHRRIAGAAGDPSASGQGVVMAVIRDGARFYNLIGGELVHIRELDCGPTAPGFTVYNCAADFTDVSIEGDGAAVDAAVGAALGGKHNFTSSGHYATFPLVDTVSGGQIQFKNACRDKTFEYARVGLAGAYAGDVEIEYTTAGLTVNPAYDAAAETAHYPKIALVLTYNSEVTDYICLGVSKKQDRLELGFYWDLKPWHNGGDLTADASAASATDWARDVKVKVKIADTGHSKAVRVYVGGVLFAARKSTSYGPMRIGFASEYAAGTVKDIAVRGDAV
ncbi:MAG: hypothetical protein LBL66_04255 [Clostridiales bacterium]|jgi:hypothetical protein|nr:hypothetical protein [Clostridiales bacterium]